MDVDKITKLAFEMLLELTEEEALEAQLLRQRLKTTLVWASIKKHDQEHDQRIRAIQDFY